MKEIIVGFSRPKKWAPFAWLIMAGFGINYDHCYVRWHSDPYNADIVFQASKLSVNFESYEAFLETNVMVDEFKISLTDENMIKLVQFAVSNANKRYGVKECFGMAIVRIAELCGRKMKNPFGDGGATYVCSELAGTILEQFAGDDIPVDLDDLTPPVIYAYLKTLKQA